MKTIIIFIVIYGAVELVNLLIKKFAFINFKYSRTLDRYRCFKGESIVLSAAAENKKLLPLSFVEIIEDMPAQLNYEINANVRNEAGRNNHYSTMTLLPYQKIIRKYNIVCPLRGRFPFSSVKINIGDLFGLRTYSMDIENPVELLVYPPVKPLNDLIIDCRNPMGDVSVNRWIIEDPTVITGIREYTSYDPLNRIHWPSSARSGRLMVKNFDFTSNQKAVVLLNVETSKPFWMQIDSDAIEKAITITASVCNELIHAGIAAGVCTNSDINGPDARETNFVLPSCTNEHMTEILELLAKVTYSPHQSFEDLLSMMLPNLHSDTHYIIVTPIITEQMAETISTMLKKYIAVSMISLTDQNINLLPDIMDIYTAKKDGAELEAV